MLTIKRRPSTSNRYFLNMDTGVRYVRKPVSYYTKDKLKKRGLNDIAG
tara:strand:+ start:1555 stop:1698 length:144 start_codon:yes stop_codon:yes gene_type:complete